LIVTHKNAERRLNTTTVKLRTRRRFGWSH